MNRRITKSMAEAAATLMMNKAYSRSIENATKNVNAAIEILVRRYVPAPVIAVVNEYPKSFYQTMVASIMAVTQRNGYTTHTPSISGTLSFAIPSACTIVVVGSKEYEALRELERKRKRIIEERNKFGDQVYEALVALKTEKAVQNELPEAMQFLSFPEVKSLPQPVFTGLRDIIAKIMSK